MSVHLTMKRACALTVSGLVLFGATSGPGARAAATTKSSTKPVATKPRATTPAAKSAVTRPAAATTVKPAVTTVVPAATAAPTTVKPSGSITVYSGRNEALVKPILEQFQADTGVKVNFRAGDSGALAAQIITEGKASPADVFFAQDAGALGAVSKAGIFEALPTALTNRVAKGFRAADNRWVGISGRLRVAIYNPSLAPTMPATIDGLLDPAWKGKIGFAPTNASWQSFVTALRVVRGEAEAKAWLVKFKNNDPKAYSGNAVVRDAVNKGDVAVGLINHYYFYEKVSLETRGSMVAKNHYFKNGDLGGLMNVAGIGVLKTSDNKTAAVALVDYLLSPKAQKYFAQTTFEYPLISSVSAVSDIPQLSTLNPPAVDLSDLDSLAATQELLASTGLLTR